PSFSAAAGADTSSSCAKSAPAQRPSDTANEARGNIEVRIADSFTGILARGGKSQYRRCSAHSLRHTRLQRAGGPWLAVRGNCYYRAVSGYPHIDHVPTAPSHRRRVFTSWICVAILTWSPFRPAG